MTTNALQSTQETSNKVQNTFSEDWFFKGAALNTALTGTLLVASLLTSQKGLLGSRWLMVLSMYTGANAVKDWFGAHRTRIAKKAEGEGAMEMVSLKLLQKREKEHAAALKELREKTEQSIPLVKPEVSIEEMRAILEELTARLEVQNVSQELNVPLSHERILQKRQLGSLTETWDALDQTLRMQRDLQKTQTDKIEEYEKSVQNLKEEIQRTLQSSQQEIATLQRKLRSEQEEHEKMQQQTQTAMKTAINIHKQTIETLQDQLQRQMNQSRQLSAELEDTKKSLPLTNQKFEQKINKMQTNTKRYIDFLHGIIEDIRDRLGGNTKQIAECETEGLKGSPWEYFIRSINSLVNLVNRNNGYSSGSSSAYSSANNSPRNSMGDDSE